MGIEPITIITTILVVLTVVGLTYGLYYIVNRYYIRIPPNRAAIIYGRTHEITNSQGEVRTRGFRIVPGGAALVIPLLEEVEFLDLSNRKIDLEVADIRSLNGVKVDVQAVAIVRIGTD